MQTFLVYPSFSHSLHCLDRARLGKQRIEAAQLINALRNPQARGWTNHPATKMWRGYEPALGVYFTLSILEWTSRGYQNTMVPCYDEHWNPNPLSCFNELMTPLSEVKMPTWLGDPKFHAAHRAALLFKLPSYYSRFGWSEQAEMNYVWPV